MTGCRRSSRSRTGTGTWWSTGNRWRPASWRWATPGPAPTLSRPRRVDRDAALPVLRQTLRDVGLTTLPFRPGVRASHESRGGAIVRMEPLREPAPSGRDRCWGSVENRTTRATGGGNWNRRSLWPREETPTVSASTVSAGLLISPEGRGPGHQRPGRPDRGLSAATGGTDPSLDRIATRSSGWRMADPTVRSGSSRD